MKTLKTLGMIALHIIILGSLLGLCATALHDGVGGWVVGNAREMGR
jgi:hypothetical protein